MCKKSWIDLRPDVVLPVVCCMGVHVHRFLTVMTVTRLAAFLTLFPCGQQALLMLASSGWRPACSWSSCPSTLPSRSCYSDFCMLSTAVRIHSVAEPIVAKHIKLFSHHCKHTVKNTALRSFSCCFLCTAFEWCTKHFALTVSFLVKGLLTVRQTSLPVLIVWFTTHFIVTSVTS